MPDQSLHNDPRQANASVNKAKKSRWTTLDLFILTLLIAVPVAFFSQYYRLVTNTVDGVRIPLKNAGISALVFASLTLGSTAYLVAYYWNASRRLAVISTVFGLLLFPFLAFFFPGPLELLDFYRPRGAQATQAQENYEAAAITASAISKYVARTSSWPTSWQSLHHDLVAAIDNGIELSYPGTGMPNRKVITKHWSPDNLRKHVDVDFAVELQTVASQRWTDLTAVSAHKPAYNMYRDQFTELIETAKRQANQQK